jgi:VCBS repeat-containing protein
MRNIILSTGMLMALSMGVKLNAQTADIAFKRDDQKQVIDVIVDGKLFTSFQYPSNLEKPFLFPVYSPDGSVITRGFPLEPRPGERVDHPHHIGIWFNYGNVNGLDFWNNSSAIEPDKKDQYGHIVVTRIDKVKSGKKGIIDVTSEWKDNKGNTLLQEKAEYIFSGEGDTRTIDHISTLTATNGKVTFADNKEGMFAIRVDRAFEMPSDESLIFTDEHGNPTTVKATDNKGVTGMYVGSSGLKGDRVWGTRNEWVLLSGTKNNVLTTIGIFDHPNNQGFPAYSHARGYGLFSVNNLGQNSYDPSKEKVSYSLEKGESITLRHRFFVQSGKAVTKEQAQAIFSAFSNEYGKNRKD